MTEVELLRETVANLQTQINELREMIAGLKPAKSRFLKPTLFEVRAYCVERKNNIDPEYFYDHYESNDWMIGKVKMKDWRATIRKWEKSIKSTNGNSNNSARMLSIGITPKEPGSYMEGV